MSGRDILIDAIGEMDPMFLREHYARSYPTAMGKFMHYASIAAVYALMCVSVLVAVPHFIKNAPATPPDTPPVVVETHNTNDDPPAATAPGTTYGDTQTKTDTTVTEDITTEDTTPAAETTEPVDTTVSEETTAPVDTIVSEETTPPVDIIVPGNPVAPDSSSAMTEPETEAVPAVTESETMEPTVTPPAVVAPPVTDNTEDTEDDPSIPEYDIAFDYVLFSSPHLITEVFPKNYFGIAVFRGKYDFNTFVNEIMPGFNSNLAEIQEIREDIYEIFDSIPEEYFWTHSVLFVPYSCSAGNSEVFYDGITVSDDRMASVNFTEYIPNPQEDTLLGNVFLIFVENSLIDNCTSLEPVFHKILGEFGEQSDPESEYFLSYSEPGGPLFLPYSTYEYAPSFYGDHFEELLETPTVSEYDTIEVFNPYVLDGRMYYTMRTTGSIISGYKPDDSIAYEESVITKDVHIIAAVREKFSGNILSLEKVGRHSGGEVLFTDRYITLPEYFHPATHEVIFFRYTLDFFPENKYEYPLTTNEPFTVPEKSVSEPVVIDVRNHIFGDADKDGRVNLTDVNYMMRYLARWEAVQLDLTEVENFVRHDTQDCFYNMPAITAVLRLIAGWDSDSFGIDVYRYEECSSVRYYLTETY